MISVSFFLFLKCGEKNWTASFKFTFMENPVEWRLSSVWNLSTMELEFDLMTGKFSIRFPHNMAILFSSNGSDPL